MSHRCGTSCRRRNGLGKCATCRTYGKSLRVIGDPDAHSETGSHRRIPGSRRYAPAPPQPPPSTRVCRHCGVYFRCPKKATHWHCPAHREPETRERPLRAPYPGLTPGEYAAHCLALAAPILAQCQTIVADALTEQDFRRGSDLCRVAMHHRSGPDGGAARLMLNQLGGLQYRPVHLPRSNPAITDVDIWQSRTAGYLSDFRLLLRDGQAVELAPSEFGVPVSHERE